MSWNLMEFLPEEGGVRRHFRDVVASYIYAVYSHLVANELTQCTPKRRKTTLSQLTQSSSHGVGTRESAIEFVANFISRDLRQKLFV